MRTFTDRSIVGGHPSLAVCLLFLAIAISPGAAERGFNLQEELEAVRGEFAIPGMSAAVVIDGAIAHRAAAGLRKADAPGTVKVDDAFMLCSVTKPFTATLAYILDEKGIMPVSTTLAQAFPELAGTMRPEYRAVTVETLLTHRSGMAYQPRTEPADEFLSISADMTKRRYEYVKAALLDRPEAAPGKKFVYGGGTIITAAMMERKTGRTWEALMEQYLFRPLRLSSAGFGAMSGNDAVTGVWEHVLENGSAKPVPWPTTYGSEVHSPAGRDVHLSTVDGARFLIASLPYHDKQPRLLSRSSLIAMQQMTADGPTSPGWFVALEDWSDYKTVQHYGDNGKSVSLLSFSPKHGAGFIIMANIAGDKAMAGLNRLAERIKTQLKNETAARPERYLLPGAAAALSFGKPATASNTYYNNPAYGPERATDGKLVTRWATDDGVGEAWIEIDLGAPREIRTILIREEFYPRVDGYRILVRTSVEEQFREITRGTRLGDECVLTPAPVTARYVRLLVLSSKKLGPTISEFQLFGASRAP